MATSPDGITWTGETTEDRSFQDLIHTGNVSGGDSNGVYVGIDGQSVYTSADGSVWEKTLIPFIGDWKALCFSYDTVIMISDDAATDRILLSNSGVGKY